jgi:hypothetical protein
VKKVKKKLGDSRVAIDVNNRDLYGAFTDSVRLRIPQRKKARLGTSLIQLDGPQMCNVSQRREK